jgi:hypothetical protein
VESRPAHDVAAARFEQAEGSLRRSGREHASRPHAPGSPAHAGRRRRRPWQPGAEMVAARLDRSLPGGSVGGLPGADGEAGRVSTRQTGARVGPRPGTAEGAAAVTEAVLSPACPRAPTPGGR